jgi:alpha-tubulin suppressor-like RCC1 family protein
MGERFPGGIISKTPPTVVAPVDGEGGSASGVWSLAEQLALQKAGSWPQKVLPKELYAWGSNNSGRLGLNDTTNRSSPVQVGALTDWAQVATGGYHTACVKTNGTLFTWGLNNNGQLGLNDATNRSSPVQVGALTNWAQVSAGLFSTACVKTNGTLFTWGSNFYGQLGLNDTAVRSSPVQVGALTNWAQVSVGHTHTACITTAGTLFTWGRNTSGALGLNDTTDCSSPVQVGALTNWAQVSAGRINTGCVTAAGTLFTWGSNNNGQLGLNDATNRSSPVQVGALTNWAQVSIGRNYSAGCVTAAGTLFTWGRNNYGQLGLNDTTNRSSPVQVGALTNWAQLSVGGRGHIACAKTDRTLFTWGHNNYGQLGLNDTTNRSSPVQVGALTNWAQVAAGTLHTACLASA